RQKLVERRIQKANSHREARHFAEDADEIAALQRQKFFQRLLARANAISENHLAHRRQTLIAEEHVFGATQPDSLCTKAARCPGIKWRVGVSPDAQLAKLVGPFHQFVKVLAELRLNRRYFAEEHSSR